MGRWGGAGDAECAVTGTPEGLGKRALQVQGAECSRAQQPEGQDGGESWGSQEEGAGHGRGTTRPRQALCEPSKDSLPHPATPFLLQPHLPLLTFLTVILYFENVI